MANTLPTWITSTSDVLLTSPNMPSNIQLGDLLFAIYLTVGSSATTDTITVSGQWQIIATQTVSNGSSSAQLVLAYTIAGASVTAPTFSGASGSNRSRCYQFRNARMAAPIGNTSKNGAVSTTTAAGFNASSDHSLIIVFGYQGGGSGFPPSGTGTWTDITNGVNALEAATEALTNSGDASGTAVITQSTFSCALIMIELLGANAAVADKYFNGLPLLDPNASAITARQSIVNRG